MSIITLDRKQEEGYFFSREKLNAFKKKYLNNKSTAVSAKKTEVITQNPPNKSLISNNQQINQVTKVEIKKPINKLMESEEHKNKRYIAYSRCERADLRKYYAMKLEDFFPITGFF